MIHGIFEEHQVHSSHHVIVSGERLFQKFLDLHPIPDWEILRVPDTLSKVAVDKRFLKYDVLVIILSKVRYRAARQITLYVRSH